MKNLFLKCIPKLINMSYFTTINNFKLKSCLIGPFSQDMFLTHQFYVITRKILKNFLNSTMKKELENDWWYYLIEMNSDETINYDLKLSISGKKNLFIHGLIYVMQHLK